MIRWDLDFIFYFSGKIFPPSLRWFNFVTHNIQFWYGSPLSPIICLTSWKDTQITSLTCIVLSIQPYLYFDSHMNNIIKLNIVLQLNHISYISIQSIQELCHCSFSIFHSNSSYHDNLQFFVAILHTSRTLRQTLQYLI